MAVSLSPNMASTLSNHWQLWGEIMSDENGKFALATLTIPFLLLAIFWYLLMFSRPRKAAEPLPPGPCCLPIVGYLPFLGANLHWTFTELASRHGPIYKLWLGQKLYIILTSPALMKELSRDLDTIFSNRDPPVAGLAVTYGGLDIVWSPYGPYWRNMRKLFVKDMLSSARLNACYNLRREGVRKAIRGLFDKIGSSVDIGEVTYRTGFDVIANMLWGNTLDKQKVDTIGAEFHVLVTELMVLLEMPNISDFYPMLARFDLQGVERKAKKVSDCFGKLIDSIIDSRMNINADKGHGKDFLQILLELMEREDREMPITTTEIKAVLTDIVVGATDTTSTTVEWVIAELIHNKDIMKKVQDELLEVIGMDNIVEESHVPNLRYLDAVVKETFRLHPAVPLILPRRPSESCTVGGYSIPKGSTVVLNVWAVQRDPRLWENPSEFRPERFLTDTVKWDYRGNNFQFLPFGAGRRLCAGLPLAEKMVMYVLASLLHSFNWNLPNGEEVDLSEKFGIVMKKRTPIIAIPTQRLRDLNLYA